MSLDLLFKLSATISQNSQPTLTENEWAELAQLADQHGLAAYLWWCGKDDTYDMSETAAHFLKNHFQETTGRWLALAYTQRHIQGILNVAGIAVLWLKGITLAQTIYPHPATRPMADIDLWVHANDYRKALSILQNNGYQGDTHTLTPHATKHFTLHGGVDNSLIIEVHHTLFDENDPQATANLEWFWQQSMAITTQDDFVYTTLTPTAHLLYLAAHALVYHGEIEFFLQRFWDMHLLITQTDINWESVLAQAVTLKWTYPLERALTLCQDYFATPLPSNILLKLVEQRPLDEDSTRVQRYQMNSPAIDRMVARFSQMPWPKQLRLIGQILFPSPQYMRDHYNIPPRRSVLWYYPYRSGILLRKLGHWFIRRWQMKRLL